MSGLFFADKPAVKTTTTYSIPNETFNHKNPQHLDLVQEQISRFSEALVALQIVDQNIVMGLAIGTGCYIGSYVFPLVLVSIAGACYASWNWGRRDQVSVQYREALNQLIAVYQWSMGKDTGHHWDKLAVKTLQDLILTLGPWVSSSTIHTWTNADLKPAMLSFSTRRNEISELFEMQLTQFAAGTQAKNWEFRLYSEHGMEHLYDVVQSNAASQVNNFLANTIGQNSK